MSDTQRVRATLPLAASVLPFQNQCGRRGCVHIFKYQGTNPFGELAAMVKAHRPYCVGRNSGWVLQRMLKFNDAR